MADKNNNKEMAVNINLDNTPIYYTDSVYITANPDGVVFDVLQKLGNTNQARIVARVGMSREHAKKFAAELSKLLAITEGHAKTNKKN
ncbi:MAG: DUF3467 domain-containing protein [Candidatus Levyibacteriota bacterium]